ncbi:hypothetical protein L484_009202 [Morus notabilis]|uniref:Uncharacterized protein n=1 Tax=Morus notabilis TaxID=981085 RepID=W9S5Y4_9ROSA|nr:hypothetical protein L484_009202 [Morus notabilis]
MTLMVAEEKRSNFAWTSMVETRQGRNEREKEADGAKERARRLGGEGEGGMGWVF